MLRVTVEERVAVAVLETEDGLYYLDGDGARIARLEPEDSAGALVRIAAGATAIGVSPALATSESSSVRHALAIEASLNQSSGPEWRLPVLWVEVVGDDDYRVYLGRAAVPDPGAIAGRGAAHRPARGAATRDPRARADPRGGRPAIREPRDRAAGDRDDRGRRRGGEAGEGDRRRRGPPRRQRDAVG